jgi:predicted short-subunit dehydrogenase-like oxidoreductase (DUF2520 family)
MTTAPRVTIIGGGRAGGSFALALGQLGWRVVLRRRGESVAHAASGGDLVLICTPDAMVAEVAAAIEPGNAVVGHVAGSLPLAVLGHHPQRAGIHPLMSLPNPELGAERLLGGGWFGVAGDAIAHDLVAALGGRAIDIADDMRALYHATACVASNHLVALLGQVERLASRAGVPAEAYLDLARGSLDNVTALGAALALTGPAARGDTATLDRHRAALPSDELALYEALVTAARRLADEAVHDHR